MRTSFCRTPVSRRPVLDTLHSDPAPTYHPQLRLHTPSRRVPAHSLRSQENRVNAKSYALRPEPDTFEGLCSRTATSYWYDPSATGSSFNLCDATIRFRVSMFKECFIASHRQQPMSARNASKTE